jgi:hypothetical protein
MVTKVKATSGLMLALVLSVVTAAKGSEGRTRVFPFPLVESEKVIGHWLRDSGHKVFRDDAVSGQVRLRAQSSSEEWEIVLKPSSPLLTEVFARPTVRVKQKEGETDNSRIDGEMQLGTVLRIPESCEFYGAKPSTGEMVDMIRKRNTDKPRAQTLRQIT